MMMTRIIVMMMMVMIIVMMMMVGVSLGERFSSDIAIHNVEYKTGLSFVMTRALIMIITLRLREMMMIYIL